MKNQNANKILWVEYWIQQAHPSYRDYEISAEALPNNKWKCEIEIPLINKTVMSTSSTEVNAMMRSSSKAAKLIDEYMKEHQELKIVNEFKGKPYQLISDENGRYQSIGLSSEYRRREGKKMIQELIENVK